jgi:hypothetical protein
VPSILAADQVARAPGATLVEMLAELESGAVSVSGPRFGAIVVGALDPLIGMTGRTMYPSRCLR